MPQISPSHTITQLAFPLIPLAKPEPLRPICHPVCLALSDSGRSPSRDRPG